MIFCAIAPSPPPIIAPANRVGANIPPGVPALKQSMVTMILSSASAISICQEKWLCNALSMAS